MYSQDKIKRMTQIALNEQNEKRHHLYAHTFSRGDYLSFYLFKTFLFVTIAFVLVIGGMFLIAVEENMISVREFEWKKYLTVIGIAYFSLLVVHGMITLIVYFLRYKAAEKFAKKQLSLLKGLAQYYPEEATDTKEGDKSYDELTGVSGTPEEDIQ